MTDLKGRSLLKETDLTAAEFGYLVDLGERARLEKHKGIGHSRLAGREIAPLFEKPSTRTRSGFEVGAHDEGAHVTYIGPGDSHLGVTETVKDVARVLGRTFDGFEYRGFAQETVEALAHYAGLPVWNGLTDTATWAMAGTTPPTRCLSPERCSAGCANLRPRRAAPFA